MSLDDSEKVSSSRWLALLFSWLLWVSLVLALLASGLQFFFDGQNFVSFILLSCFVVLLVGLAGFVKHYWFDFKNSFLNFLVNIFFPATSQDAMFIIAIISILILLSTVLSYRSLFDLYSVSFSVFVLKVGTLLSALIILLFLPVFLTELYFVVADNKPSDRFTRKVVYVNTLTMFFLSVTGGVYFVFNTGWNDVLGMFGTVLLFFQGLLVFLMMLFKNTFEERILAFRVMYDEPPVKVLRALLFLIVSLFLVFYFVFSFGILLSALNTVGLAILASTIMKWGFAKKLYSSAREKFK